MDFRQLRNLVFVARYASFGIAANKLNVTQPALSKSIRALEQATGVRLLDRGPWGVRPTEFGERLIAYAEAVLALTDDARDELDAMRGAQRGRLRVGGTATTVRTILPNAARQLLSAHPGVNLTLNEELSPALQNQLLAGTIDIAMMSRPRDFPDEELEYRELMKVPLVVVTDPGHPLAARDSVSLADLGDWLWIIPARPDPDRTTLDAFFATAQLPLPQAICETTSSTFQVSMLMGSPWLSYVSSTSAFARGPGAQLVPLRLELPRWTRSIGIAWRRRPAYRPLVSRFIRDVTTICAEMEAEICGPFNL
jgi:DNA-binding transcriptional LysR family regulator